MSDERLRELERRWRATGAADDGAAWLVERVRIGDLEASRLMLAAYLGHHAARAAVDAPPAVPGDDGAWLAGLEGLEPGSATRACALAVLAVVGACRRTGRPVPAEKDTRAILQAVEDWLICPCETHALTCYFDHGYFGEAPAEVEWLVDSLRLVLMYEGSERLQQAERSFRLSARRLEEVKGDGAGARLRTMVATSLAERALAPRAVVQDPAAARLLARRADGSLSLERLRVAALMGHGPAMLALGLERSADEFHLHDAIAEAGVEASIVASLAAKQACGLRPGAKGIGHCPIEDSRAADWIREAVGRVGAETVLPAVRGAVIRWALT